MASKSRSSRFVDDAALQALVRFGPQLDILKQAQRTARSEYDTSIAQADAGRVGVQQAVDAAAPQVAQIYERAGLGQAHVANTLIGHDLAGLSGVADSIKGGAALEAAGMAGRLGDAQTAALTGLANRRVQATTGAVTAKRQAQMTLVSNLAKILQSGQDLSGQKGAFEASALNNLVNQSLDRSHTTNLHNQDNAQRERNSVRSSGINPDTMKPIPGGKLDPKAKKPGRTVLPGGASLATSNEHGTAKDAIHEAETWIRRLSSSQHLDEQTIKDHLVAGDTLTDASNNKLKLPTIAADYVQAAWEIKNKGGVSRRTAAALHARGLSLKQLGLASRGSSKGRAVSAERHAYDVAQALAKSLGG